MGSPEMVFSITEADVRAALDRFEDAPLTPSEFAELCRFVRGRYECLAPEELDGCVADYLAELRLAAREWVETIV